MTIDDAIGYFGSGYKMCRLLGITPQNFTRWTNMGFIPLHHQLKLQELSNDILKARSTDGHTRYSVDEINDCNDEYDDKCE